MRVDDNTDVLSQSEHVKEKQKKESGCMKARPQETTKAKKRKEKKRHVEREEKSLPRSSGVRDRQREKRREEKRRETQTVYQKKKEGLTESCMRRRE